MPKTLLLADDSVTIQKVVGITFANEDVELVTVDNGDAALARARDVVPDIVLADVSMPGLTGYELCAALKREPGLSHIPVILLTGTFEGYDEERTREAGADGHIAKPFEAQALVELVHSTLERAAAQPLAAPAEPAERLALAPAPEPEPLAPPVLPPALPPAPPQPAPSAETVLLTTPEPESDEPARRSPARAEFEFADLDFGPSGGSGDATRIMDAPAPPTPTPPSADVTHVMQAPPVDPTERPPEPAPEPLGEPRFTPQSPEPGPTFVTEREPSFAPPAREPEAELEREPRLTPAQPEPSPPQARRELSFERPAMLSPDPRQPEPAVAPEPREPRVTTELQTRAPESRPPEPPIDAVLYEEPSFLDPRTPLSQAASGDELADLSDPSAEDTGATPVEPEGSQGDSQIFGAPVARPDAAPPRPESAPSLEDRREPTPPFVTPEPRRWLEPDPPSPPEPSASFEPQHPLGVVGVTEADTAPSFASGAEDRVLSAADAPEAAGALPADDGLLLEEARVVPELGMDDDEGVQELELMAERAPAAPPVSAPLGAEIDLEQEPYSPAPAVREPELEAPSPRSRPQAGPLDSQALHTALEKIAWEAFGPLSEQIMREVLQKVEEIAWDVIPQLAERLIQEELARLRSELDD